LSRVHHRGHGDVAAGRGHASCGDCPRHSGRSGGQTDLCVIAASAHALSLRGHVAGRIAPGAWAAGGRRRRDGVRSVASDTLTGCVSGRCRGGVRQIQIRRSVLGERCLQLRNVRTTRTNPLVFVITLKSHGVGKKKVRERFSPELKKTHHPHREEQDCTNARLFVCLVVLTPEVKTETLIFDLRLGVQIKMGQLLQSYELARESKMNFTWQHVLQLPFIHSDRYNIQSYPTSSVNLQHKFSTCIQQHASFEYNPMQSAGLNIKLFMQHRKAQHGVRLLTGIIGNRAGVVIL